MQAQNKKVEINGKEYRIKQMIQDDQKDTLYDEKEWAEYLSKSVYAKSKVWGWSKTLYDTTKNWLEDKQARVVADIGCGPGYGPGLQIEEYIPLLSVEELYGIDNNIEAIKSWLKKAEEIGVKNIHAIHGDINRAKQEFLPKEEKGDLVLGGLIDQYLTPHGREVFIDSVYNFLNENGYLIISTQFAHCNMREIKPEWSVILNPLNWKYVKKAADFAKHAMSQGTFPEIKEFYDKYSQKFKKVDEVVFLKPKSRDQEPHGVISLWQKKS